MAYLFQQHAETLEAKSRGSVSRGLAKLRYGKDYEIGTLHYNWPMSAHMSQAFSTYTSARDCSDLEHLPQITCVIRDVVCYVEIIQNAVDM